MQARHQGDTDRVVSARLALQDGARPALDLLAAENGEDHRRIGRCDGGSDQNRGVPGQVEGVIGEHRRPRHRQKRAQDADHGDGPRGQPGSAASRCSCHRRTRRR